MAHSGGSLRVSASIPETKQEVLSLVKQYLRENFDSDAVEYVTQNEDKRIILFDKELDLPPHKGRSVASGSFVVPADHPVQTVWEHQFEVQYDAETDTLWVVVMDNLGTAPESWDRKVEQNKLSL